VLHRTPAPGAAERTLVDNFDILDDCDDRLPVARLVDRVIFSRFIALTIERPGGGEEPAVYPSDWAVPDIYLERQVTKWPPTGDLLDKYRGGKSILKQFEKPSPEIVRRDYETVRVEHLDSFFADPTVEVYGSNVELSLTPENVVALESTGATFVRLKDKSGSVLIQTALVSEATTPPPVIVELEEPTVASVLSRVGALRKSGVLLEAANVEELRNFGETTVAGKADAPDTRIVVSTSYEMKATQSPESRTAISKLPSKDWLQHAVLPPEELVPQYEIPTFPFVIYLPYRQDWLLEGFARGDLLNSIALAPLEEATIEIFSWDRSKQSTDTTEEYAWESSLESGTTNRATRDIVSDVTRNESWKLTSAGVNIGIMEYVDIGVNAGGDVGTAMTNVNKETIGKIDEATTKATFKARGLRQTKVSEAREFGFEERSTRKLKNPNSGRTITYDAFEVLSAYNIETAPIVDQIQMAVLVDSPISVRFDRQSIINHEGVWRRALLDTALEPGFDAAKWLAAREEYCAVVKEPYCGRCPEEQCGGCKDKAPAAQTPAQASVPAGKAEESSPPGGGWVVRSALSSGTSGDVAAAAQRVVGAGDEVMKAITKVRTATHRIKASYDAGTRRPALDPVILEYRQWLCRKFGFEKLQPAFWSSCTRFEQEFPGRHTPERVEQLTNETGFAWAEALGRSSLAAIALGPISLVALAVELIGDLGWDTGWYSEYTLMGPDDAGLGGLLQTARNEVGLWRQAMQPPPADATQQQAPPPATAPAAVIPTAPTAENEPNPFPDDETARRRVEERALIAHMVEHESHYLEALWRSIGPSDRARLIDTVAGKLGRDVVPEIVGFVGDKIALPFRVEHYAPLKKALVKIRKLISEEPATPAAHVVLPTPGIELHTRVGECDALEPFAVKHREFDLEGAKQRVREQTARAAAAEFETDRFEARLKAKPPELDDPVTHSTGPLTVRVEGFDSKAETPPAAPAAPPTP
jgi:hypothetical protein